MTDINSIIEMIEKCKKTTDLDQFSVFGYNNACDDIIEQLRKMSEWMPIDTAPKDGTEILVCGGKYDHEGSPIEFYDWDFDDVATVYWNHNAYTSAITGERCGEWQDYEYIYRPTHWMPLPKPPNSKEL